MSINIFFGTIMKNLRVLIVCIFLCTFGTKSQTINPSFSNVDYVGKGNTKQMLDIYIPSGATTPTPAIIHIHGGAFLMGSKSTTDQSSLQFFYNSR